MPQDSSSGDSQRRAFLQTATGLLILQPQTVFGSQANSNVEFGLIGCGGRGNWITPLFHEYTGARVVALADVQRPHLDATREKFSVDATRAYYGPQAARELIASKVDAVVIETPTYYHPEHAQMAVDAGKHVFMAKPVAVDVPGCQTVTESGRKAMSKKLSYWVDFQTRARDVYKEVARRVHGGDIGKPVFAQVHYYAGRPSKDKSKPGMDPGQRRMLNFYMDKVLGGDIIVEQNIHVIDVANWLLGGHPLKAHGTGGRTDWSGTDYDAGDAWDHFAVNFWYPDNVHASFSSHQLTRAFSDLCVQVFGIRGCADTHYGGTVRILGEKPYEGVAKDDTFRGGAVENAKMFIAAVREGKPIYNFEPSVESNLTAILGRTAAYQQREVTWEELLQSREKWNADMKLAW
ncbi:MAG: Gfo/Idh/MocA family oxidoreductase [Bryobacterales bacterium]|nr:Gfo/Idh/MocA family oxidoreductase [Bryobacterales bacterium]